MLPIPPSRALRSVLQPVLTCFVLWFTLAANPATATRSADDRPRVDFAPCMPVTKVYTLDADFNLGALNGVVTNVDQLELDPTPSTWPYAWIANAGEGTLSKVDTQTGNEVARYYTGPPDGFGNYPYLYPSRTVVDKNGDCWVANRTQGNFRPSVTQIVTSGGIDRNLNSIIDTSTDLNSNGQIDPTEILPWGQDERIIRHYALGGVLGNPARGMTLDKAGFLWIGLTTSMQLIKVSPTLSTVTYSPTNPPTVAPSLVTVPLPSGIIYPYGLALAPNGMIYMSTLSHRAFRFDPGTASGGTGAGPAFTEVINHGGTNYGIAVDKNCIVWIALMNGPTNTEGIVRWDPPLTAGNPLNGFTYGPASTSDPGPGRGIAVDFNNNVWLATNNGANSIIKYTNAVSPTIIGEYPTPSITPVGVGAASDGNIIVTPNNNSTWCKLNQGTGAVMALAGPTLAGLQPYTYSDFTGSQQTLSGLQQGTWTVITDGGSNSIVWTFLGWNAATPALTSVQVEYRIAQTLPLLSSGTWTTIGSPGAPGPPVQGRYIETRARLQRVIETCGDPFVTPILYDLTVQAICDSCSFSFCQADTTVPCMTPQGAEVEYSPAVLSPLCDSTYVITCTPPSPGFFPVGTTPVTCIAVNAMDDTVKCQFNVTVLPGCDPPATGACCIGTACSVITEAQCRLMGGIYFGNNTNCVGGCNKNCATPPNNLIAWWPFDDGSGGVTPNLAGPPTSGILVNNPTQAAGEYVNSSYSFDGATQYINVPHHETLDLNSDDFSFDLWVKTTQSTGIATLLDKRNSAPVQGTALFLYDGYPGLQIGVGGSYDNYILSDLNGGTEAFVADGNWHFLAVTVDRDDDHGIQFYVDGEPLGGQFNPTAHQGNLGSTSPLTIASGNPALGVNRFAGHLDEIEIIRRELTFSDVQRIWLPNVSGKCPEACYVTQNVPCCQGLSGSSSVTICNYSNTPHLYSWGATPLTSGPGCGPVGPSSFTPSGGTLTVPAFGCVTIPIQVGCPSNVPAGQVACYQVSIFNHDTGRIFGCQGSVRRAGKWCIFRDLDVIGVEVGIIPVYPGIATPVKFDVSNIEEPSPTGAQLDYTIVALSGDTDSPSTDIKLNGLPPGEPVIGTLSIAPGGSGEVTLNVEYGHAALIGHDRLILMADENNTGLIEPLGEVALRAVMPGVSDAGPITPPAPGISDGRLLLEVPNPFAASDRIRFRVEGDSPQEIKLQLFDFMGRSVKIFHYGQKLPPGEYSVDWNTKDDRGERLPTGIYFLKLVVGKRTESMKVLVRN